MDSWIHFNSYVAEGEIHYLNFDLEIYLINDVGEEKEQVGIGKLYSFNGNIYNNSKILINASSVSNDTSGALRSVRIFKTKSDYEEQENYSSDHIVNVYGYLGVLEELIIVPEYRDKGIGTRTINEIINYCKAAGINFLLFKTTSLRRGWFVGEGRM